MALAMSGAGVAWACRRLILRRRPVCVAPSSIPMRRSPVNNPNPTPACISSGVHMPTLRPFFFERRGLCEASYAQEDPLDDPIAVAEDESESEDDGLISGSDCEGFFPSKVPEPKVTKPSSRGGLDDYSFDPMDYYKDDFYKDDYYKRMDPGYFDEDE